MIITLKVRKVGVIFFIIILSNIYEVLPMCIYEHHVYILGAGRDHKMALAALELEVQMVVNHSVGY